MKKSYLISSVVVVALVTITIYRWFTAPVAEVYVAKRGTAISAVYGTIKVVPSFSINLRTRTSGNIEFAEVLLSKQTVTGIEVKKSQELARILNPDLDRELSKAEADLAAAEKRYELGPPSSPTLKTQDAMVARLKKLVEVQNASTSDLERATNDLQSLRERVKGEQVELDRIITIAREQANSLRYRKENSVIRSPVDGVVTTINVSNGEFVYENNNPFTVASLDKYIEGRINEEDVGQVSTGMKTSVRLYSYATKEFPGTVTQVLPTANNQQYTINLTLDNPPGNLMSGMTGEMNIVTGKRENVLIVPTRALLAEKLLVVSGGIIKPRSVKVGFRNIARAEIVEGLKEGEQVVVADQDLFKPGQRVRAITINQ